MQDDRLYDEKELEKSWLLSYSDLFTLLFVIIVIIAAAHSAKLDKQMAQVAKAEQDQQQAVQEAVKSRDILELQKLELQREIAVLEARQKELLAAPQQPAKQVESDMETIRNELAAALQEWNIPFEETGEGLLIRLPESILFSSGSADLQQQGKATIASIAEVLERFPYRVRIEGYTDNVPVRHSAYRSNWELSSARAISVMREMVDSHGLAASRFMVAGWGEHHPLVDNTTEENRARNRRVELVILSEKAEEPVGE